MSIDGERAEAVVPGSSAPAAPRAQRPDAVARILSAAIVGTLAGVVTAKIFGRKAGFVALVAGGAAHELFDAPLARHLGALGL